MTETAAPPSSNRLNSLNDALSLSGKVFALSAAAGTVLFAIRVFSVAHGNMPVASALIINSTLASMVFTTTLLVVLLVAIASPWWLAWLYLTLRTPRSKWRIRLRFMLFAAAAGFLVALGVPGVLIWFGLIVGAANFLLAVKALEGSKRNERYWQRFLWAGLAIPVLSIIAVLFLPTMWLPAERAVINGIPAKVYVLSQESQGYVVFDPSRHAVLRIPESGLSDRQYCVEANYEPSWLEGLFGQSTGLPDCP